ncbi:MAG: hypothetical protein ACE5G7_05365 [Candidatus Hydrothermarchaeaceae archaeon]
MGRNVLLLGLVSLVTDASSEIIMPILPMYIAALWEYAEPSATFLYGAAMAFIAVMLFVLKGE